MKPETKINRNPSGKTPVELANLYYDDALGPVTGRSFFDADITVDLIIDIQMFAGQSPTNDILEELINDGDLDELFGREIKSDEDLFRTPGFIVRGTVQKWDWTDVVFDAEGSFERGPSSDIGRYIIFGYGGTLELAYKSMVEMAVKRAAKNIKEGLAAV